MDNNYKKANKSTRESKKNMTLVAIAVTFTLLLLIFAILLCMNVAMAIKDRSANNDNDPPQEEGGQTPDTPTDPPVPDSSTVTLPTSAIHEGTLILVNSSHVYEFPNTEEHLTDIYASQKAAQTHEVYYKLGGKSNYKLYMEKNAYQAMNKLLIAFFEHSNLNNVLLQSAYRTYDYQNQLYQNGGSTAPGYSDSHTGLSCALQVQSGNKTLYLSSSDAYDWIYDNCHKYGFVVRYPAGKEALTGVSDYDYYFRYVGYVHAYVMKTQNKCLEEYVADLRNYSVESPLSMTTDDASNYEIYYVPAVGTETAVPVPSENTYTISGDNEGGFIVTVKLS